MSACSEAAGDEAISPGNYGYRVNFVEIIGKFRVDDFFTPATRRFPGAAYRNQGRGAGVDGLTV